MIEELLKLKPLMEKQQISFEQFVKYIETINATLRGKQLGDENTGLYKGDMLAADLVSPTNDVQYEVLKKYYDVLPRILSSKAKATLSYYIFNDLHLFEDGNGRLARFMYQMFEGTFDDNYVKHDESDIAVKSYEMETEKEILDIDSVNFWCNYIVFSLLRKEGSITNDSRLDNFQTIKTFGNSGFVLDHSNGQVAIPKNIKQQLGTAEVNRFVRNITNNNGNITNAGISMCIILSKLGTMQLSLDRNDENIKKLQEKKENDRDIVFSKRLVFRIGDKSSEDVAINFLNWSSNTYRQFSDVAENLHKRQLETLIDIFTRPQEYMWNQDECFLEKFTNEQYFVDGYDTVIISPKTDIGNGKSIQQVLQFNSEPKSPISMTNAKVNNVTKIVSVIMTENDTYIGHTSAKIYDDGTAGMDMCPFMYKNLPSSLNGFRNQLKEMPASDVAFYTNPLYRKQGIGTYLQQHLLQYLSQEGIELLKVNSVSNEAKKIYIDTGAIMTSENIAYYNDISKILKMPNKEYENRTL